VIGREDADFSGERATVWAPSDPDHGSASSSALFWATKGEGLLMGAPNGDNWTLV